MLTAAFRAVVERFNLNGVRSVMPRPAQSSSTRKDYNLTRECVLSRFDPRRRAWICSVPVARVSSRVLIGNKIALGQIDSAWQAHDSNQPMRRLSIPLLSAAAVCKASVAFGLARLAHSSAAATSLQAGPPGRR